MATGSLSPRPVRGKLPTWPPVAGPPNRVSWSNPALARLLLEMFAGFEGIEDNTDLVPDADVINTVNPVSE